MRFGHIREKSWTLNFPAPSVGSRVEVRAGPMIVLAGPRRCLPRRRVSPGFAGHDSDAAFLCIHTKRVQWSSHSHQPNCRSMQVTRVSGCRGCRMPVVVRAPFDDPVVVLVPSPS